MPPVIVYAIVGLVLGAIGGVIMNRAAPIADQGALEAARLARLGLIGALIGCAGAVVDRSGKKLVAGALAGALGLVVAFLLLERTLLLEWDVRPVVAVALAVAGGYGALVVLIYGLVEPDFRGVSYALILGAIGGLSGVAASFVLSIVVRLDQWGILVFFSLYAGLVWTCGALSRKLERAEAEP